LDLINADTYGARIGVGSFNSPASKEKMKALFKRLAGGELEAQFFDAEDVKSLKTVLDVYTTLDVNIQRCGGERALASAVDWSWAELAFGHRDGVKTGPD